MGKVAAFHRTVQGSSHSSLHNGSVGGFFFCEAKPILAKFWLENTVLVRGVNLQPLKNAKIWNHLVNAKRASQKKRTFFKKFFEGKKVYLRWNVNSKTIIGSEGVEPL